MTALAEKGRNCQNRGLRMASPVPTPQQLYERLREVTRVTSDFELAKELGVQPGVFTGMKRGKTPNYEHTILFLQKAGWLSIGDGADERANAARATDLQNRMLGLLAQLSELLPEVEQEPPQP